jgi:hypothetical protein
MSFTRKAAERSSHMRHSGQKANCAVKNAMNLEDVEFKKTGGKDVWSGWKYDGRIN